MPALAAPARVRTGAAASSRARFRPADLLKQVMIQDLAVAPDGERVVYARRTIEDGKYRKRLWRIAWRGGRPEQLTAAEANDGAPRFSPDGRTLLFLSDRSGKSQPWLLPLDGGEPRRLCEIEGDVRAAEWSPDGRMVLLLAPSGEERFVVGDAKDPVARRIVDFTWRWDGIGFRDQFVSLWVVPAAGGKPRRLTPAGYEVETACWSPDGRRIAFTADRRPEAALCELAQAWTLPVEGDGMEPEPAGELAGYVRQVAWLPTGRLALSGIDRPFAAGWATTGLFAVEDGRPRRIAADLDCPIEKTSYGDLIDPDASISCAWLDGDTLVALVSDRGASHPYRFDLRTGEAERLVEGEVVCSALATGGGRIVVVATDRGRAGEVYAVEGGKLRPLTRDGSRWLAPYRRDPERRTVRHPDGHDLDAWIVPARANGDGEGRLVIQIHGGPHATHGPTPWLEMLALADAGISVLYPNPRGSTSYGEAFAKAIHGCWGEPDGEDVAFLAGWAASEGLADPKRIGVLGLSGGGFMVNWLLGHYPGTFAAGVSENPVTDFTGMFGESDVGQLPPENFIGLPPLWKDPAAWLPRSPYTLLHKNEAPLLLIHCDRDLRCPPGQSELAFAILRSLGRTVEMVRYPEEPHYLVGIGRPDRRVDRIERIVTWFERYL